MRIGNRDCRSDFLGGAQSTESACRLGGRSRLQPDTLADRLARAKSRRALRADDIAARPCGESGKFPEHGLAGTSHCLSQYRRGCRAVQSMGDFSRPVARADDRSGETRSAPGHARRRSERTGSPDPAQALVCLPHAFAVPLQLDRLSGRLDRASLRKRAGARRGPACRRDHDRAKFQVLREGRTPSLSRISAARDRFARGLCHARDDRHRLPLPARTAVTAKQPATGRAVGPTCRQKHQGLGKDRCLGHHPVPACRCGPGAQRQTERQSRLRHGLFGARHHRWREGLARGGTVAKLVLSRRLGGAFRQSRIPATRDRRGLDVLQPER